MIAEALIIKAIVATPEIDFSFWALFARATITVKIVILLLIGASFWAWSIIIQRHLVFNKARRDAARFDRAFWSGEPLDELYQQLGQNPRGRAAKIFVAGMKEWEQSQRADGGLIAGIQSRIDRSMDVAVSREAEKLQSGLTVLATVGSTAPFVGLFGTVWGIMNAFIEIAQQQNTNLAVVAPGIAEALLATGLGLLAAIPAVVFYNKLNADCDRLVASYESFADEFSTILSRQLDS
jgi:biopolymer transport protein TolQ